MKLLVLSPFPPRRDAPHGGARWVAGLVAQLAGSHRVGLLTLRGPGEQGVEPEIAGLCELVGEIERGSARTSPVRTWRERQRLAMAATGAPGWAVGFSVRGFAAALDRVVSEWQPDVIHIESVVMAQYAERLDGLPIVVVDHDPADGSRSMRRFRARVLRRANAVVAFTDRDRTAIAALVPTLRIERIPLAVDVPLVPLDPVGNGRDVTFIGNFMHPPNVDAAERLAGGIFPRIALERPDARLVLVGADPPASLQARASDKIVVTGQVADIHTFLDAAAVVVAPISSGGGMRVKALEALASGKALVASSLALEGIDVRGGEHALVAADDSAFARAVVGLLDDDARRMALGRAARAWAETHVEWRPVTAAYESLYASLLDGRAKRLVR
jgi:glycosyltransferase involved in cell wall biosynthesis